jgi:hypothetical protein
MFPFKFETFPVDPSSLAKEMDERKASARKTLRRASVEELRALALELFPGGEHPWAALFLRFIEEHSSEPAVRGETSDGYAFVYYPRSNRGIWYENSGNAFAVGLIGPTGLRSLSEIGAEHGYI